MGEICTFWQWKYILLIDGLIFPGRFSVYFFFIYIPFLFFYLLRTTFVYYLTRAQKKFKFYFPPVFKEFIVALLVFKLS